VKQQDLTPRFELGAPLAKSDEAASVPRLVLTPVEEDSHWGAVVTSSTSASRQSCAGFGVDASVAIAEIEDWLRRNAALTLERD
jgi:hypothetical protein